MTDADEAPGWAAIDAALDRLYPGVEPKHLAAALPWVAGGRDPLDGISFYPRPDHWHAVSYGMTELFAKESNDPDESGWGFEFTVRVARSDGDDQPPIWAANLLQNLGRYVISSGNAFGPGHRIDARGPIRLDRPDTALRALGFTVDPELGSIDTPHGRVQFLQVVGLTYDEYEAAGRWDMNRFLDLVAQHLPLLVTDVDRRSLLEREEVAAAVTAGIERDGSTTGALFIAHAAWRRAPATMDAPAAIVLSIGASAVVSVAGVLPGRLPHGQPLLLQGKEQRIGLVPANEFGVTERSDNLVELRLPSEVTDELLTLLRPVAGVHRLRTAPGLIVEIVRSQIRDQAGNVIEEIG